MRVIRYQSFFFPPRNFFIFALTPEVTGARRFFFFFLQSTAGFRFFRCRQHWSVKIWGPSAVDSYSIFFFCPWYINNLMRRWGRWIPNTFWAYYPKLEQQIKFQTGSTKDLLLSGQIEQNNLNPTLQRYWFCFTKKQKKFGPQTRGPIPSLQVRVNRNSIGHFKNFI